VHGEVQGRADGRAVRVELAPIVRDSCVQFGMFSEDQDPAIVLLLGVEKRQVDAVELAGGRRRRETVTLVVGH
jgi:hypothetical protein